MPVTKSAKRALRTAHRRHKENLETKDIYKKAVKGARKALETGAGQVSDLLSKASSALDRAAKKNAIHRNKAARLKSRLAKKAGITAAPEKPATDAKKATPKKAAPKTTKKAAQKKTTAKKK